MSIVLIGMPGCGKTTVGQLLADRLECEFVDTDHLVFLRTEKTPRQIVEEEGLESFLQIQEQAVLALSGENCVIATGGGIVHSAAAMAHLSAVGIVVYLDTEYDTIEKRMDQSRKLVRKGGSLLDLFNARVPLYRQYADVVLQCDSCSPALICDKILEKVTCKD